MDGFVPMSATIGSKGGTGTTVQDTWTHREERTLNVLPG